MRIVRLGDIATWGSGGTPARSEPNHFGGGLPWLSVAELNDAFVASSKETLSESGLTSSSAKLIPPGSILVAMYASVGKLGITQAEVTTSQAVAHGIINRSIASTRYIYHYLLHQRPQIRRFARGVTQKNIGLADLRGWPVPLPSLDEQERIVKVLDQADLLRAKRRQTLNHLDELGQSLFFDVFGDLATARRGRGVMRIGDLARGSQYGTATKASADDAVPILRMGNITDSGRIDTSDVKYVNLRESELPKYTVQRGDLLFNRTNSFEKVGKAAVVRSEPGWAYAGYLVRVRFESPEWAEYVSGFLRSPDGIRLRKAAAKTAVNQANINAQEMLSFPIPRVTEELVMKYTRALEEIERRRAANVRCLTISEQLFASLQSRAFRGEL